MAKSPIKRMQEAELESFRYTRSIVWERSSGPTYREYDVELSDGRTIHVTSSWLTKAYATCSMQHDGRFYTVFVSGTKVESRETARRLAVAFADRVAKEAKAKR